MGDLPLEIISLCTSGLVYIFLVSGNPFLTGLHLKSPQCKSVKAASQSKYCS